MQDELIVEAPKVHCAGTMVPTDKVVPNPDNPNVHSEDQVEMLAGILRASGWRQSIVVSRRSGMVVKGHGRLLAARAGKAEIPGVKVERQESLAVSGR